MSSAALTISMNTAPLGGVITVDPTLGQSMVTVFKLLTSQWTDDDIPLTYEFGFINPDTRRGAMVLQSISSKSHTSSTLPPGSSSPPQSILTVFARALDMFSADSTAVANPVVEKVNVNARNLTDAFDNAITGNGDNNFVDTKKILAVITSVMNSVDCTALTINCSAINREACGKVANTCGDCVSGYVGIVGPSDTKCWLAAQNADSQRRKLIFAGVGNSCSTAADCMGDINDEALVCRDNKCAEPVKYCIHNCSGRGICLSRDTRTYVNLAVCFQSDIYCETVCKCESSYGGKACEISSDELTSRQNMRVKLLKGLRNITVSEDNSARNVITWIELLSVMSLNIEDLAVDSIVEMLKICEFVIKNTEHVALEYEEIMKLLNPMNAILLAVDNLDFPARAYLAATYTGIDIKILIRMLSNRIAADVVIGQENPSYVNANLRLLVTKPDLFENKQVKIGVPPTVNEIYNGVVPSFCELDMNSSSTVLLVSRNVGSYNNSRFLSNPLEVSVSSPVCSTKPCQIIFDLQSNSEIDYSTNSTDNINNSSLTVFVTKCQESDVRTVNYTCASGQVIEHSCNGESLCVDCCVDCC